MKQYCLDCKEVVNVVENDKDKDTGLVYDVCQVCGGDDVTPDYSHCELCEEPKDDDSLREGICHGCLGESKKDFSYELEMIFAKRSNAYRKAVNIAYDGETL